MAQQTRQLLYQDGGLLTVSYIYEDTTLQIVRINAVNNNTRSYQLSATRLSNGKNYTFTLQPNTTINQTIPTGAANRLQLFVGTNGKLDGVEWAVS